jgi:hypothetical protein
MRHAVQYVQNKMFCYKDIQKFINSEIKYEEPNSNINSFNGIFAHTGSLDKALDRDIVENIDVRNTIW